PSSRADEVPVDNGAPAPSVTAPTPRRRLQRPVSFLVLAPVILVVLVLGGVATGWKSKTYNVPGSIIVFALVWVAGQPFLTRAIRREDDVRMARLLKWAFFVKLLSAYARYEV